MTLCTIFSRLNQYSRGRERDLFENNAGLCASFGKLIDQYNTKDFDIVLYKSAAFGIHIFLVWQDCNRTTQGITGLSNGNTCKIPNMIIKINNSIPN